jgi:hypothetical protein
MPGAIGRPGCRRLIARTLLMKAPERANSGSAMKLAQQLRRLTVFETGKTSGAQQQ